MRWEEVTFMRKVETVILAMEKNKVLGLDYPTILGSMVELTSLCQKKETWKEAEPLELQVLKRRRMLLGPEHPETLKKGQDSTEIRHPDVLTKGVRRPRH